MSDITSLIDKLNISHALSFNEWVRVIRDADDNDRAYAAELARGIALDRFGNGILLRGLVEFSNVCRNDCLYCGIRCSNKCLSRYTLTDEEIVASYDAAYDAGIMTCVLQSGEGAVTAERLAGIVRDIKRRHPDCAVTLSVGELSSEEYRLLRDAGADRYLLRHETADAEHYARLHPAGMCLGSRIDCLHELRRLGFWIGAGMMVGSPYQTTEHLARDMMFLCELSPEMVGIGPFIPHRDTPFADMPCGSFDMTLHLLSLIRIMLPGCQRDHARCIAPSCA